MLAYVVAAGQSYFELASYNNTYVSSPNCSIGHIYILGIKEMILNMMHSGCDPFRYSLSGCSLYCTILIHHLSSSLQEKKKDKWDFVVCQFWPVYSDFLKAQQRGLNMKRCRLTGHSLVAQL